MGGVRGLETVNNNGNQNPRDSPYSFQADQEVLTDSAIPTVRLSRLRWSLTLVGNGVNIYTDVDVPQGKQVVVGKSTAGDRAYILVVSAKVLN
jgi:hypothetical protein